MARNACARPRAQLLDHQAWQPCPARGPSRRFSANFAIIACQHLATFIVASRDAPCVRANLNRSSCCRCCRSFCRRISDAAVEPLGFGGLVIFGILMICVGFTDALEANSSFSEQVIVHGYTRQSERAVQRTNLRSEIHFAFSAIVAGMGTAGAGLCGLYFG